MKENVLTVYRCDFCGETYFSARGCRRHENFFCKKNPNRRRVRRKVDEETYLGIPLFGKAGTA